MGGPAQPDPFRPGPEDHRLGPSPGYPGRSAPSHHPSTPLPNSTPRGTPSRPATVWIAVVALTVAAIGAMAQMVIAVVVFNTVGTTVTTDGRWSHVTDHYRTMSGWAVAVLAVIAIGFAVGYCALAFFVWRGTAWPRYAVSVLALFSLFGLLGGPVILVMVVAGALAAVMLWLPSSMLFCTGVAMSAAPAASNPFAPSGPPPSQWPPSQWQPGQRQADPWQR